MYVGSIFLDGFRQHRVDEANDRCVIIAFEQIGRFEFLGDLTEVKVLIEAIDHLRRAVGILTVRFLQQRIEDFGGDSRKLQRHAGKTAHFNNALRRCATAVNGVAAILVQAAYQDAVTLGERKGQRPTGLDRGLGFSR